MNLRRLASGVLATCVLAPLIGTGAAHADYSPAPRETWVPNKTVYAVAVRGDRVYIGGSFTAVRNPVTGERVPRSRVAAFDVATGDLVRDFDASADATVNALAVSGDGSRVFVGGSFSTVNGAPLRGLAAVDRSGALVPGWGTTQTDTTLVRDLVASDGDLYVAGRFEEIGGKPRRNLAELDAATGEATTWQANANQGRALALALSADGSQLFVGGEFHLVGGVHRDFLAAVSTAAGEPSAWIPEMICDTCRVLDLVVDGNAVYAGVGGNNNGGRLAAYEVGTSHWKWFDHADGDVQAVAYRDGVVYAGGHFGPTFDRRERHQLAAVRASDGGLLDYAPTFGDMDTPGIWALDAGTDYLRVGGGFEGERPYYTEFEAIVAPPPNEPPEAQPTSVATEYQTPVAVTVSATDPEGGVLGYAVSTPPAHGTVTGDGPTFGYTPEDGFSGSDSFGFTVTDPEGATDTETVTVTVAQPPPTAVTPAEVTFADSCATVDDTYTVPSTAGVTYQVDGATRPAGTYPGTGAVAVEAIARPGFRADGTSAWRHTFADQPCARVRHLRVILDGGQPVLRWRLPADGGATQVLVRRRGGARPPLTANEGTQVYAGGDGRVADLVRPGDTYTYTVWTVDEHGHVSNTSRTITMRALRTPALDAPSQAFLTARRLGFRVDWGSASDPDETRYRVEWRYPGTAWQSWLTETLAQSGRFGRAERPVQLHQGDDIRFRVVAVDPWGNRTRAVRDRSHVAATPGTGLVPAPAAVPPATVP